MQTNTYADNYDALREDALESLGQMQADVEAFLAETRESDSEDFARLDELYYILDEMQAELGNDENVAAMKRLGDN
jgi:predicted RNA polymerase sigma factor